MGCDLNMGRLQTLIRRARVSLGGAMYVTATVRSMTEPERSWTGRFRIDAGVVDCVVPRRHLEAIGLTAQGTRVYELEDGEFERVDVTTGRIEIMGEVVGATVVMGDEAVLGMTALESLGSERDTRNQLLKRLPYVRLR